MSLLPGPLSATCAIAVMGKASVPGRVKTRLVPAVGSNDAAALNTAFLQDMIGNVILAGATVPINPFVAFSPAGSEAFFREHLPRGVGLIQCSEQRFGANLIRAVDSLLTLGYGSACVLNADSPTLPTRCLIAAARELARPGDRVVIGPTVDGGYYFLGVKQAHDRLFRDIDWSTERVYRQTCQRAEQLGLHITPLETWYDVDDAAALARLGAELSMTESSHSAADPYRAPHTRSVFGQLTGPAPVLPAGTVLSATARVSY